MLQVPQVGFQRSVNQSNVEKNSLADWLEAIALFDEGEISKNDVVDILIEYEVCADGAQDLAHEIASEGWEELRLRKAWGGLPNTFTINSNRLSEEGAWQVDLPRSFFLLLSLMRIFPDWAQENQDHVTQGNYFEEVVELICPALLPGWEVYRAGWSPANAKNVQAIVNDLCERIHVQGALDIEEWHAPQANDAGLDIVCYRRFADQREASPVYFLQCASGKNWRDKIMTPSAHLWQKLLNSAVQPSTGIAAPFVIETKELKRAAVEGQIAIFDRLRLLNAAAANNIEIPAALSENLRAWMEVRIDSIPRAS